MCRLSKFELMVTYVRGVSLLKFQVKKKTDRVILDTVISSSNIVLTIITLERMCLGLQNLE